MAKAMIIFEDDGEYVEITIKGVLSDKLTTAQEMALRLYKEIDQTVKEIKNGEEARS